VRQLLLAAGLAFALGLGAAAPGSVPAAAQIAIPLPPDIGGGELDFGRFGAKRKPDFGVFGRDVQPKEGEFQIIPESAPCTLCRVIEALAFEAEQFTRRVAPTLHALFTDLFRVLLLAWIVVVGIRLTVGLVPPPAETAGRAVLAVVIFLALAWVDLWWSYVYLVFRDITLGLAMTIVNAISNVGIPRGAEDYTPFAQIFGIIENSIMSILTAGFAEITKPVPAAAGDPSWAERNIPGLGDVRAGLQGLSNAFREFLQLLWGVILMIPYAFVMLLFAAYIVEGLFKFLAVTALTPVWLVCAFLPRTRPFTEAALRLYLSGGLTIVFASLAMGFTLAVTHEFLAILVAAVNDADTLLIEIWAYWGLLLLGFVSLLLHLKAATLASNISGANDGTGPAAATVAAGKLIVAAGVVASWRALGGRGAMSALAGSAAGRAGQYGVPGLAAGAARQAGAYTTPYMAEMARRFRAGRGQE